MKVLFLAHRIPFPPNKGEKIRAFNEIRHLSRKHDVHLIAFGDDVTDRQYAKDLRNHCRTVTIIPMAGWMQKLKAGVSLLRGEPFTLGYFRHSAMRAAVRNALAQTKFDVIFVYCSSMAPYVAGANAIPKILDFVDSDANKWTQYSLHKGPSTKWLYRREGDRLKKFELEMIERFDRSAFVAAREGSHVPSHLKSKVAVVANGIDLNFYQPNFGSGAASHKIVFTGAMDYFPNIDAVSYFAQEVFVHIKREVPDAEFAIVGSRPTAAVQELASIPGVVVTGTVPDVRPFLASAHVAVAPFRVAQGIQNKILEALAAGLPVVATRVAAGGVVPMAHAPLTMVDTAEEFIKAVCERLMRPRLDTDQVRLCRQDLREHYDWTVNLSAFDTMIEELVPSDRASQSRPVSMATAEIFSK
jgi:polysaccharide biosynthesis protein PslH